MTALFTSLRNALELADSTPGFSESGALPSAFAVTDLASASLAAAGQALAELLEQQTGTRPEVSVDRRLASFWFASSLRPLGWSVPPLWDPLAGDYASSDGWIRLHTNARHHRDAAERVLGAVTDRAQMATQVARWSAAELEQALVDAGGCAAQMRSWAEWQVHPQGRAVNAEPLVLRGRHDGGPPRPWQGSLAQPLAGLKVLDLTRVLAGPSASRLLAGLGANVLRIDPPTWEEPGVVPEMTLGKRCARLDLQQTTDRQVFERLLRETDILIHGYRADALERLGYGEQYRQQLAPGLIDVRLNAYGWSGPWRNRRGFDSLVQMSSGIAEAGMRWQAANQPVPLPVQALDHATGYLMAATAIQALGQRLRNGQGTCARLSLARTAKLLVECGVENPAEALAPETPADLAPHLELTAWGPAHRLQAPLAISGSALHWALPAGPLGSHPPRW